MVTERYSTYQAKAQLSALLRKVSHDRRIIITRHGKPVAELGPVSEGPEATESRLDRLIEEGAVEPATVPLKAAFAPLRKAPGALARFLAERDEAPTD